MFLKCVSHLRLKESDETIVDVYFDCEQFNIAVYAFHFLARTDVKCKTINEIILGPQLKSCFKRPRQTEQLTSKEM